MDTVSSDIFLCAVMSSLFVPQRNQNEKIWYWSRHLPCFITVTCAGLHLGVLLASFVFFFVMMRHWSLLLAAVHLLSEGVSFIFFLCLSSWLHSPADAVCCSALVQILFFAIPCYCAHNVCLVTSDKAHSHKAIAITVIDYWVLDLKIKIKHFVRKPNLTYKNVFVK